MKNGAVSSYELERSSAPSSILISREKVTENSYLEASKGKEVHNSAIRRLPLLRGKTLFKRLRSATFGITLLAGADKKRRCLSEGLRTIEKGDYRTALSIWEEKGKETRENEGSSTS